MDMPASNSNAKQPDKQLQHKPAQQETAAPTTAPRTIPAQVVGQPMAPQTLPAEWVHGTQGLLGAGNMAHQAQLLTKPGVLTAQRQAAVAEIGRQQGNRHVAQVVQRAQAQQAKSQTLSPKSTARTAPIQRSAGTRSSDTAEAATTAEPLALGGELEGLGGGGKVLVGGTPPSGGGEKPTLNRQAPVTQVQREEVGGEGQSEPSANKNKQVVPITQKQKKMQVQRDSDKPAPFNEVDNLIGEVPVTYTPGELTRISEGTGSKTLKIHWPKTNNSGVTLGYGYDMGNRNRASIIQDLENAGVSPTNAAHLADAAGLKGGDAQEFVKNHATASWAKIEDSQRTALFDQIYPRYQSRARDLATNTKPIKNKRGDGVNAAARGKQYVVPTEIYDHLHPVIQEILTDLTYPGQYSYNRHEKINLILNDYRLSTLEKLRAIRNYLNAPTTTGIGRKARIKSRTELINKAIGELEKKMTMMISERRKQLMALPPMSSEERNRIQSELESLEKAYGNQQPSTLGLEETYQEDLINLREQLRNMPDTSSEKRAHLEKRIQILEKLYGATTPKQN